MRRARRITLLVLITLTSGGLLLAVRRHRVAIARVSGPLPQEAYVWQRAWTAEVKDAVRREGQSFKGLVALGAEINWHAGRAEVVRVPVDYSLLAFSTCSPAVALRIGPYHGPFAADDSPARLICDTAATLTADAAASHAPLRELQLDFDCPTSKLEGYRLWAEAIRRRIAPVHLTITVLPTWLKSRGFAALAHSTDGFILQVHSLDRPAHFDAFVALCDTAAARRAVDEAALLGVPFRVALPTYGYLAAFDASGAFLGLSAEGIRQSWPSGVRLREVNSDPAAMASLIRLWQADRPTTMCGIIWYRLPCDADDRNWRWPTLRSVMAGRDPAPQVEASVRHEQARLWEVDLRNSGDAEAVLNQSVEITWRGSPSIAADALAGFECADNSDCTTAASSDQQSLTICQLSGTTPRLSPGEHRVIGWLRLQEETEVQAHVDVNRRKP